MCTATCKQCLLFSAVPDTLKDGPQTVGAAKTQIHEPVSEYAPALEGIAGQPVAPDPTAKYGPALGSLTGDAPAEGTGTGVVGAVTAAAGSVVNTVKHVRPRPTPLTLVNQFDFPNALARPV